MLFNMISKHISQFNPNTFIDCINCISKIGYDLVNKINRFSRYVALSILHFLLYFIVKTLTIRA